MLHVPVWQVQGNGQGKAGSKVGPSCGHTTMNPVLSFLLLQVLSPVPACRHGVGKKVVGMVVGMLQAGSRKETSHEMQEALSLGNRGRGGCPMPARDLGTMGTEGHNGMDRTSTTNKARLVWGVFLSQTHKEQELGTRFK